MLVIKVLILILIRRLVICHLLIEKRHIKHFQNLLQFMVRFIQFDWDQY